MRLTNPETKLKLSDTKRYDLQDHKMFEKLKELEDIEEDFGVDLISFLKEMSHLMKTASQTTGYTMSGKEITTDYGYVEEFLQQLKGALK